MLLKSWLACRGRHLAGEWPGASLLTQPCPINLCFSNDQACCSLFHIWAAFKKCSVDFSHTEIAESEGSEH